MSHRLPRTVLPDRYTLELTPNLPDHSFTGTAEIAATVFEATSTIVCNAADLEIHDLQVDGTDTSFTLDADAETLTIELDEPRAPGPIAISTSFTGELNDQLRGFYRSTFTDDDGTEHIIATTQMQSTDARRAFPCWDEPDMKAVFDVTLVVDPALTAISNGAEVGRETRPDGNVAVSFEETMKMSTYLVAFVVGPLVATEPAMAGSTPVRIVHRPGQEHLTQFALDVAVAALAYFEDYYGIPYPSGKLDMVALPDFAMGAMENLGCVTYREVLLLVDPATATQPELQNVADVVNHELAHMWFGDLVTMGWWNGIWLNEAFATFMEMKATDSFAPDWDRWTSFGISRSAAFDIDSLVATRPIEFPVVTPEDAEGMFDLLTYEKGAAVVRMLEQWLGEEPFRDGIRHYLDQHRFGNTETHDLWDALEHVSGRPVRSAMETWIFQGGYPLIEVDGGTITQRRFTYTGEGEPGLWTVPVQVRDKAGATTVIELDGAEAPSPVAVDAAASYNHSGHGFYRVKLSDEALADFGANGTSHLPAVERFGLVDDTWTLTLAGDVSVESFLGLLAGYAQESDVSVWQRIVGALSFIHHVAPDELLAPLGDRISELITPARDRLGSTPAEGESARLRQLRGTLFATAGNLTDAPDVIAEAAALHGTPDADSELFSAAVRVLASNGDAARFADFRNRFESSDNPQEQIRYLYSMPLFPGAEQIAELTEMAGTGVIRSQNAPFVLSRALMSRDHGTAVWEYITSHWDELGEMFPSNTIVRMLEGIRWLTAPDAAAGVADFFADKPLPQGQKQLDQHLERLQVNTQFHQRVGAELPAILSR